MGHRQSILSWHGLRLTLPPEWSPVQITGDWADGSIQIADLRAARLSVRWQTPKRRATFDAEASVKRSLEGEELSPPIDWRPDEAWSPARWRMSKDAWRWAGYHRPSHRLVEIACLAPEELAEPSRLNLRATTQDATRFWSIFDLSCTVPRGWTLRSHRLNAGDLSLTFGHGRETLTIRQLGPATLALARQPLAKWLETQSRAWRKLYQSGPPLPLGEGSGVRAPDRSDHASHPKNQGFGAAMTRPHPGPLPEGEGDIPGLVLHRRRRFFYLRQLTPQRILLARHDAARDRLIFVDAPSLELAQQTLASVGQIGDDATPA